MTVILSVHEGVAIAIDLPRHVTLEITETEPVVKGQTASSSCNPAVCRTAFALVPPRLTPPARASSSRRKTVPTWNAPRTDPF